MVIAAALVLGVGLAVWGLSWMAPSWWRPPDPRDRAIAVLADQVEQRLLEEAHKIRPVSETWTIRVREHQVNAWLSVRLPDWIAHEQEARWPEPLGTPQIHFEDEGISVAVEVGAEGRPRFVVVRVVPTIHDDGLRLRLNAVGLGRIPVPGEPVEALLDLLGHAAPVGLLEDPAVAKTLHLLGGRQPLDPTVTLPDGRRVHLLGLRYAAGRLDLTCRTLGNAAPGLAGGD